MLSIGSELSGGIRNVLMEDCRAESDVDKVFFIKTNPERGGFVERVYFFHKAFFQTRPGVSRPQSGRERRFSLGWLAVP